MSTQEIKATGGWGGVQFWEGGAEPGMLDMQQPAVAIRIIQDPEGEKN